MRSKNKKYLIRLIIFSLLLGIIPVVFQGILFYNKLSQIVQEKVNQLNTQFLRQTQEGIENILHSIYSHYIALANSYLIQYMEIDLSFEKYDEIINIQRRLVEFQDLYPWVKSAYTINFNNNWIIGNDGFGYFKEMENQSMIFDLMSEPEYCFWSYIENPSDTSRHMNVTKEFPLDSLILFIKLPINSKNPQQAIVVNLSTEAISEMLRGTDNIGKTLILDERYRVIAASDMQMIGKDLSKQPYISQIENLSGDPEFFELRDENLSFVWITCIKSEYNGWIYLKIYPVSEITRDSRIVGLISIFICIIVIALTVCFSVFGSKLMYKPVKSVYETIKEILYKNTRFNKDKDGDEFDFISKGINILVSTNYDMQEEIENQISQLEEFLFYQIISGELSEDAIRHRLNRLGYSYDWKHMYIVTLQIDYSEKSKNKNNEKDLEIITIRNIIITGLPRKYELQPILKKSQIIMLIAGYWNDLIEAKEFILKYVQKIKHRVYAELEIEISAGISSRFDSMSYAWIAYKESIEALICRLRDVQDSILFFDEVHTEKNMNIPYPKRLEGELIDVINRGDMNYASKLLGEIIDEFFRMGSSANDLYLCLLRLLVNIVKILQDLGDTVGNLFPRLEILYESLYSLKTPDEIKNWFVSEIINPVITTLEKRRLSQRKAVVDKIIKIIETEYDTDLTIESCAERLNYHPSHIWRILKEELNTTFSEYLTQYRLKIARQLLRDTDLTIAEIAQKLRYANSQNFIRSFKNAEGATPGEYRKLYRSFKSKTIIGQNDN